MSAKYNRHRLSKYVMMYTQFHYLNFLEGGNCFSTLSLSPVDKLQHGSGATFVYLRRQLIPLIDSLLGYISYVPIISGLYNL